MNKELMTINKWLISNKLAINTDKTHFIIFSKHKTINYPFSLIIRIILGRYCE